MANQGAGQLQELEGRFYRKDVPSSSQLPLIVFLHGAGGGGLSHKYENKVNLNAVTIHPFAKHNGKLTAWNSGVGFNDAVDDLAWLESLIEQVKEDENIDPAKVYISGHSNGGMMAYRYCCVKGGIAKAFIYNAALTQLENFTYTGELSLWKSMQDDNIPVEGNARYKSLIYEYRQMQNHIAPRSELRLVGGAGHTVKSFKEGLTALGTTLEIEMKRFFEV